MLIGFIGSHGTGKTTTAEALSDITRMPMLGSTARTANAMGLPVNDKASMLSQLLVTISRANQVLESRYIAAAAVTDRTPLDSYAYTTYQVDHVWDQADYMQWYLDQSRQLVTYAMKQYTYLFYFPILWEPENDGVRLVDVDYQKTIDDRLIVLIRELGLNVTEMPDATPLERAHMIKHMVTPVMV
jgi:hypothetical protein